MKKTNFDTVSKHIPALEIFALKFTRDLDSAQDLVQETMLRAIKHYGKFEEGTNMKAWLFTILKNNFINKFRRDQADSAVISQSDELSYTQLMASGTHNGGEDRFIMSDIREALASLPEIYFTPFSRYVEGYKYQEISGDLAIPIGTVKTRIYEARRMLRRKLSDYAYLIPEN